MIVNVKSQSARFYDRQGNAVHEVIGRNGEPRPVNLKHDRAKLVSGEWVPSVTSICRMLHKENLVNWRIEQAIISAITLPKRPEESAHEFAERVVEDMDQERDKAAEGGRAIHYAIQAFCEGDKYDEKYAPQVRAFAEFCESRNLTNLRPEVVLVGPDCAGRTDLIADSPWGPVIVDHKSQDRDVFKFWDDVLYQIGGYAHICEANNTVAWEALRGLSFVVHRVANGTVARWDAHLWDFDDIVRGKQVFRGLLQAFRGMNRL